MGEELALGVSGCRWTGLRFYQESEHSQGTFILEVFIRSMMSYIRRKEKDYEVNSFKFVTSNKTKTVFILGTRFGNLEK